MEFLNSYLSRQFAGKPLVASRNVSCFRRLGYLFISEVKKRQVKITHQNTGVMFLRRGGTRNSATKLRACTETCKVTKSQYPHKHQIKARGMFLIVVFPLEREQNES